ncbi:MAG: AAA family ATPase [Saprospiraceae bacterium]
MEKIKSINKKSIKRILSENISTDERKAIDRLNELIGLGNVKKEIKGRMNVLRLIKTNPRMVSNNRLHLTFEGNPGTGKTTVARIVSEIYQEEGILERGHLVEASRADLVAQYVGHTAQKTGEICKRAMGGVLFIDEAYSLKQNDSDTFGQEAIDTLIKYMEDFKNDFCVIMAGYPHDMEKLLSANAGIKSRIGKRIKFEDFNPEELFAIYQFNKKKNNLRTSENFEISLRHILKNLYIQRDQDFGNAREVEKILQGAFSEFANRCSLEDVSPEEALMESEDIPEEYKILDKEDDLKKALDKACQELNQMVGLAKVKELIKDLVESIEADNKRRAVMPDLKESIYNLHLIFSGNPGTGKTTVARLLGKIFKILKVISKGHVVETQRADLVAEYTGQTAPKVKAKVKEAMDGILFIDEAYALSKGKNDVFGEEAIETLLKEMEDKKDRLVVIAAGYPDDMENLIQRNAGLRSRFTNIIVFDDYSPDELVEIFRRMASQKKFIIGEGVDLLIAQALTEIKQSKPRVWQCQGVRKLFRYYEINLDKRVNKMSEPPKEDLLTFNRGYTAFCVDAGIVWSLL